MDLIMIPAERIDKYDVAKVPQEEPELNPALNEIE